MHLVKQLTIPRLCLRGKYMQQPTSSFIFFWSKIGKPQKEKLTETPVLEELKAGF